MLELFLTSFPVIFRYYQLKRRGEEMTIWNMKAAVFSWAVLAFLLFLVIFYFHPKTYSGILPFRTVSVVAQTSGPVTSVNVTNGSYVAAGDVLFHIEDSTQQAAVKQASTQFEAITASEAKAKEAIKAAEASVDQAQASLDQIEQDLSNARTLLERNVGTVDAVRKLETQRATAEAALAAASAQVAVAQTDLDVTIPAQRDAAQAALDAAQVELDKTVVKSFTSGTVTQLALGVGSPASMLILAPAMVIIPERPEGQKVQIAAGFSQVARATLYEGMPAELACDSNIGLPFRDAVVPARVSSIQPAVASGQIVPGGKLLDPATMQGRGSMLVYLELIHPEHEAMMLDGSGCFVQTYTDNLAGAFGHIIAATGIIKAGALRLKVWGSLVTGIGLVGAGGH
ncbi:HlyD family secretion protein [Roseovarius sp. S1116L3]|uniref:HlyD family secretion protein n=1 Tax=Roseovarius roseus TaxID=3342636 RepID=UPI003727A22C